MIAAGREAKGPQDHVKLLLFPHGPPIRSLVLPKYLQFFSNNKSCSQRYRAHTSHPMAGGMLAGTPRSVNAQKLLRHIWEFFPRMGGRIIDLVPICSPTLLFFGKLASCLVTAAAAKSLQSYPTLYDPIDGSPPGSAFPGILQAGTLEWVAISFSNA